MTAPADDTGDHDDDDDGDTYVDAVPCRYVTEVLCPTLPTDIKRALGSIKKFYVRIDDLLTLKRIKAGQRPAYPDVRRWCLATFDKDYDFYAAIMSLEELRGVLAVGQDSTRKIALATLQGAAVDGAPWAAAAVQKLRDRNTVARTDRRRTPDLTLTVGDLITFGATATEVGVLPTVNESTQAASAKIIEAWNAADWTEARTPAPGTVTLEFVRASEVKAEHIDWLWSTSGMDPFTVGVEADWIPLHGLTLVAGREQSGKSTLCWWFAAQLTRGTLPGHYEGTPRDVVVFSTEDFAPKLRMRFHAAGADMDRVHLPVVRNEHGDKVTFSTRDNLDVLSAALRDYEPALVVFDPLKDHLYDGVNTDREDEVRPALTPLLDLTMEHHCAVVGIHHLNKKAAGDFNSRLTGSGAFKNVARAVIGVNWDVSTDFRQVELKKSNDAALPRMAMQGQLELVTLADADGKLETVPRWAWSGASMVDLDTALAAREQGGKSGSSGERAKDALVTYFGGFGRKFAKPSEEVREAVAQRLGISEETVRRAFKELGGMSERLKVRAAGTVWWLPSDEDDEDNAASER